MRALKYKLGRSALENIYFAFVRPLFGYGCVVWDNAPRHEYLFNGMEKIQAARIITGTNNYAQKTYFTKKQVGKNCPKDGNITA